MHENIAQIYEVVRRDNKIYIFMEYCKNGELFDKINRTGPMAEKEAAKIFNQILSALLYLKESGLSHRDIKPENVLFDENWNVKLIDFGFSCLSSMGEFRRTICGTPSYTAPEILRRQSYDAELVDVWCLGVTLYAMLAAQLPFEGDTPEKRKANIMAFKFEQKSFFSVKAQNLFSSIFVESKRRAKLWDLKTSEFSLSFEPSRPHFIDFKSESILVEDQIIEIIDREYHIDGQKVVESVKSCRFDKYHAMYYLTLKH
jgi:5'-AMP-activated protein kinase catalytic alpha subunit